MERLTWRQADGAVCPRVVKGTDYHYIAGEFTQKVYDKLAAYEDAEEQGRLVRLPCKVGDTVYRVIDECEFPADCGTKMLCKGCEYRHLFVEKESFRFSHLTDSGKLCDFLYLTREEAEAALEGERDDV